MDTRFAPLLAFGLLLAGCDRLPPSEDRLTTVAGGDAERGRRLVSQYQCGRCHVVPDVPAAEGRSAPSLAGWGQRIYVAGRLQNEPQNLQRWLRSPASAVPGATMPDLGIGEADARDLAAYLMGLR